MGTIPVLKLNGREPDPGCVLARYQVPSLAALLAVGSPSSRVMADGH